MPEADFKKNQLLIDAVIRNIEIVWEANNRISPHDQAQLPERLQAVAREFNEAINKGKLRETRKVAERSHQIVWQAIKELESSLTPNRHCLMMPWHCSWTFDGGNAQRSRLVTDPASVAATRRKGGPLGNMELVRGGRSASLGEGSGRSGPSP